MLTRTFATLTVVLALAAGASTGQAMPGQQPPEKPTPQVSQAPPRHNVKLEITILDQQEGAEPVRKTVSMILADRRSGRVRTSGNVAQGPHRIGLVLNVDAEPIVLDDNRIQVDLGLEYAPKPSEIVSAGNGQQPPQLSERLSLVLVPGKPMVVSETSDPTSDRRISVELTATILK